jgi:hypothetical protein
MENFDKEGESEKEYEANSWHVVTNCWN